MQSLDKILYPPIEAYDQQRIRVSSIHELHLEQSGNPKGIPVLFLHGGPGAGCAAYHRQFFDPKKFRAILFDQRGSGRSTPYAELRENTTWDLVEDIEKIRTHLGIEKWHVFGGSWGSTLALAYAETHPDRCLSLVLRGIFLLRQKEIDWFYQKGCDWIYPDAWEKYLAPIPKEEQGDMVSAYYKRLCSVDRNTRMQAAKAWSIWEGTTCTLDSIVDVADSHGADTFAEAFARIECHYFINKGFMKYDGQLLEESTKLEHIPVHIVHGRYDVVCPLENAWSLAKKIPHANLHIIQNSGHAVTELGTAKKLVEILNSL